MGYLDKTNFIHQSQWVQNSMQTVARELEKSPTTNKKFHALSRQLDATLKVLKEQSASTVFAKSAASSMEEQIVSLYGRVADAWVKTEMSQIKKEATGIEESLKCGKVTAKTVHKLAQHLRTFKRDHRPSISDRQVLKDAEHVMARATAQLKGKSIAEARALPPIQEINDPAINIEQETSDLLDIAGLIYKRDFSHAKMKYHQLPSHQKNRLQEHMQVLGSTVFTDAFESIQAFVTMAQEMVLGSADYPTRPEIEELFEGLAQIKEEEAAAPDKIFSLRSRVSLGA